MLRKVEKIKLACTEETLTDLNECTYQDNRFHFVDEMGKPATFYKADQLGEGAYGVAWLYVDDLQTPQKKIVVKEEKRDLENGRYNHKLLRELPFLQIRFNGRAAFAGDILKRSKPIYVVMPFIKGKSYKDFEITSPIVFLQVIIAMIKDLQFLHEAKFIHGDLRPDNLFIQKDAKGNYKALFYDFSNSFFIRNDLIPGFGKAWMEFLPPEWKEDVLPQASLDVYSLGNLIGYKLENSIACSQDLKTQMNAILEKMMQEKPEDRISLNEALAGFEKILHLLMPSYLHALDLIEVEYKKLTSQPLTLEHLKKLKCCYQYRAMLLAHQFTDNEMLAILTKVEKIQQGKEMSWDSDVIQWVGAGKYVHDNFSSILTALSSQERMQFIEGINTQELQEHCVTKLEDLQVCYATLNEKQIFGVFKTLEFQHIKKIVEKDAKNLEKFGDNLNYFLKWFINELKKEFDSQKQQSFSESIFSLFGKKQISVYENMLSFFDKLNLKPEVYKVILSLVNEIYFASRKENLNYICEGETLGKEINLNAAAALAAALQGKQVSLKEHEKALNSDNLVAMYARYRRL